MKLITMLEPFKQEMPSYILMQENYTKFYRYVSLHMDICDKLTSVIDCVTRDGINYSIKQEHVCYWLHYCSHNGVYNCEEFKLEELDAALARFHELADAE